MAQPAAFRRNSGSVSLTHPPPEIMRSSPDGNMDTQRASEIAPVGNELVPYVAQNVIDLTDYAYMYMMNVIAHMAQAIVAQYAR